MPREWNEQLGQFTGPGEVAALQRAIKADLENVRASLQRCSDAGTFTPEKQPGDWDAFQSLKKRAQDYVDESPAILSTVSQFERGEVIQKEVASWHDKAKALGCDAGSAPMLPVEKTPLFSFAGLSTTAMLIMGILYLWGKNK